MARFWEEFKKRLDPRRGQLGKIDLLQPITDQQRANKATRQALQVQQEAVQTQIRQQEQQVARQRRSAVRQSIIARGRGACNLKLRINLLTTSMKTQRFIKGCLSSIESLVALHQLILF